MSEQETPVAEGQLNKKDGSAVVVQHESANIYYRPDTGELVFLAGDITGDFEKHWSDLLISMNAMHQTGEKYSMAVEKYGIAYCTVSQSADVSGLEDAATKAQREHDEAKTKLQDKLGEFTPKGYDAVVELIPIKTKGKGRANGPGSRYVYVKKGYYDSLGTGKKHVLGLDASDTESASKSIYIYDKQGNRKGIDTKKLKKIVSDFKFPKPELKVELFKFDKDDIGSIDKTLTDWADSWNNSLIVDSKEVGQNIDVSAGAQFMRFTANAGASGEWDVKDSKLTFKAEGEAVLAIAQGAASATYYYPDRVGWPLIYNEDDSGQTINMGMIRLCAEIELVGFAGASAQIENQLQVATLSGKDMKQIMMGKREKDKSKQLPIFSQRRNSGALFKKKMADEDEGVTSSAEVFGGAKAEVSIKGGVQWLQPKAATEYQGKTGDEAKAVAEFVDFCSIGASVAGMAGLGIGYKFYCTFLNGKFCFKIAASLCCGMGAKGAFLCEVGYEKLKDFGAWLAYQLYVNNYHHLELISESAFQAFSRICVMLLSDMKSVIEGAFNDANSQVIKIFAIYNDFIDSVQDGRDASTKRNEIANEINRNPLVLLGYTPEAKGMLLYILTRHGLWDHFDPKNYGDIFIPDIYRDRKRAVMNVIYSIQTKREWDMVMLHRSADGYDLSDKMPMGKNEIITIQVKELTEFLQEGLNRDDEILNHSQLVNLIQSSESLKNQPAIGYAVAMNNSYEYLLAHGDNPHYPKSGIFKPLSNNYTVS